MDHSGRCPAGRARALDPLVSSSEPGVCLSLVCSASKEGFKRHFAFLKFYLLNEHTVKLTFCTQICHFFNTCVGSYNPLSCQSTAQPLHPRKNPFLLPFLSVHPAQGHPLLPRGLVSVSGDIFVVTTWGRCSWHRVRGD